MQTSVTQIRSTVQNNTKIMEFVQRTFLYHISEWNGKANQAKCRRSPMGGKDDQSAGKEARWTELLEDAQGTDTDQDSTWNCPDSVTRTNSALLLLWHVMIMILMMTMMVIHYQYSTARQILHGDRGHLPCLPAYPPVMINWIIVRCPTDFQHMQTKTSILNDGL